MIRTIIALVPLWTVATCFVVRLYEGINHQGATKDVSIDNSRPCVDVIHDFNDRTSSINTFGQCVKLYENNNCFGRSIQVAPGTPSHNDLRQLGFDKETSSLGVCNDGSNPMATPPERWTEHWGTNEGFVTEHSSVLTRKFYDNDIAVYFDANVSSGASWMFDYMGRVWRYVKQAYGPFGKGRFYLIYHAGKSGFGFVCQPSTHLKRDIEYKSALDCISGDRNSWATGTDLEVEMSVHEMAHVVEGSFGGVIESPAFEIWQDSKWAEIFMYDVYRAIGDNRHADAWYRAMTASDRDLQNEHLTYNQYPAPGTNWFQEFFYPIYSRYGGAQVLRNFFQLLVNYFPKINGGKEYARRMNMGEFMHYWSGAAGTSVLPLAKRTFEWSRYPEFQQQLDQAMRDFPNIRYNM